MENGLKVGTKEFYDVMNQFENDMSRMIYGHSFEREIRGHVPVDRFYCDGFVNSLFNSFLMGISYQKSIGL